MSGIIRKYIRRLIEVQGNSDLITIDVGLRVRTPKKGNIQVPDIMTNLRVAPGIAIVRQTEPLTRLGESRDILKLEIKYMPVSGDLLTTIETVGKLIKKIPGVEIVKILKVGGRDVRKPNGEPFLY
tara:strand:- start:6373 stop:6750 length:378 start_codon:yes stop_codon:yes gene_type:complete